MINQQTVPDPVNDRDEFKRRLKTMICWTNEYTLQEATEALLTADAVKIADINAARQRCINEINQYLDEWDNAPNENARRQVCGKPKKNRRNS